MENPCKLCLVFLFCFIFKEALLPYNIVLCMHHHKSIFLEIRLSFPLQFHISPLNQFTHILPISLLVTIALILSSLFCFFI